MRKRIIWSLMGVGFISSTYVFVITGGVASLQNAFAWTARESQAAAIFFVSSISSGQIQNDYNNVNVQSNTTKTEASDGKVRVLIVPGHQPNVGGTEFAGLLERDVVVDIADALALLLKQNPHYQVMVSRTKTEWNPILQSFFDTHANEIETFKQTQAAQMADVIASGRFILEEDQVYHNSVNSLAALQLYGINKWSSDNKYDITLHIHLNDYGGRRPNRVGIYDGFAVYVPDHQYSNAAASKSVAQMIAARLSAYHATSTLPKEDEGIVEDRELIATGANNSVDGASILIEYAYIFEPQIQSDSIRPVAIADYAYQTYLGLQDFFKDPVPRTRGSISFPYDWESVTAKKGERGVGVYALQSALRYLGYYPPQNMEFSECPITGVVGPCTRLAIEEFQRAHSLTVTGALAPQTRKALDDELSVK